EVGADPGRLTIAFSDQPVVATEVAPELSAAVEDVAALLESLGHDVVRDRPAVDAGHFNEVFTTIWLAMVAWMIRDWSRRTGREPAPEWFERHTWKMYEIDQSRRPSDFLLAVQDMHRFAREAAPFFERYDAWLTPTVTRTPPPLGWFDFDPAHPRRATARLESFPRFTAFANVTGHPGISLPLAWSEDGLPIGIHFTGRYGDEATLLRIAGQLEAARPWHERWPALADD
ncbi:MAG: amidase family protein, partial [Gammaproteobacteria bacterium]